MGVHIFGKIDSPCIANLVVKKTAEDQAKSYSKRAIESSLERFYTGNFLELFSSQTEAINICLNLTKFVSNDREIFKS